MTKKEIVQILALLRSAFPNTRIEPETTANLWYSLYFQEDFEVAKKATEIVITTSDFFPTHNKFKEALERARMLITYENKTKSLPAFSEETIQRQLDEIEAMWASDDD